MSKIDYDLSLIKGIVFDVDGVLSPTVVPMSVDGIPMRMANLKDGYALQLAAKQGLKMAIISGGDSPAVAKRFNALGINDVYMKAGDKITILKDWMKSNGLRGDEVAYCGDDIPDLVAMRAVGLSVAPADAAVDVLAEAHYVTDAKGGYGVARELIEQILKARCAWPLQAEGFGR